MTTDVPERYRPSDAGTVAVSTTKGEYATASLTQSATNYLDLSEGMTLSWVAHDETTVRAVPGATPSALAMTNVYTPSDNPEQPRCAVPNAALEHLNAEIGDRVRFCYPPDHDERWLALEVVDDA